MKVTNIKKGKREQVFELLDKQGYILDQDLFKICPDENWLCNAQEHIRAWDKLKKDREFFKDKKIVEKKKGYRSHLVRLEGMKQDSYYKVGKEFYNEILA